MAVKPETVIEKLKNNTLKDAEEKIKTLGELKNAKEYEELNELHKTGIEPVKNQELSTAIKGRANLYSQIRDTIESAENSVYIATSAFELATKQKMFADMFATLKKRRIELKVIVSDSEEEAKKISKKFGTTIKSKNLKSRFVIVDKRELIFTTKPNSVHEDLDCGVWINSEFFSNAMAFLFDLAWKD
jgi:sugar-specific transcriptional regulator TrmB